MLALDLRTKDFTHPTPAGCTHRTPQIFVLGELSHVLGNDLYYLLGIPGQDLEARLPRNLDSGPTPGLSK